MIYQAITFSWLVGEVVRRASDRSFAAFVRDEISRPLDLGNSLFVGIPDEVEPRVALLEQAPPSPPADAAGATAAEPENPAIPSWLGPLHLWMNRLDARRACIPASNGIMTAHAVARHYAALLPGGVEGVELLPPSRIRKATTRQWPAGNAAGEPPPPCFGLGYALGNPDSVMGGREEIFGHGGFGGSLGFADPRHGLAVGIAKNRFYPKETTRLLVNELRAALRMP
jgi:CubicO group peptidase (beta-lactamase class C family)